MIMIAKFVFFNCKKINDKFITINHIDNIDHPNNKFFNIQLSYNEFEMSNLSI